MLFKRLLCLLTKCRRGSISQPRTVLLALVDRGRSDSVLSNLTTGFLSAVILANETLLVSSEVADKSMGADSLLTRLVPFDSLSFEYHSSTLTQRTLLTTPVELGSLDIDELRDCRLSIGASRSFDNVCLLFVSSFDGADSISSRKVTGATFRGGRIFFLAVFDSVKQENEIYKSTFSLLKVKRTDCSRPAFCLETLCV